MLPTHLEYCHLDEYFLTTLWKKVSKQTKQNSTILPFISVLQPFVDGETFSRYDKISFYQIHLLISSLQEEKLYQIYAKKNIILMRI